MIQAPLHEIPCRYVNDTDKCQIIRISNIPFWFFERAVFPGKAIIFKAFSNAVLEVHTGLFSSAILSDVIPCDRLCQSIGGTPDDMLKSLDFS